MGPASTQRNGFLEAAQLKHEAIQLDLEPPDEIEEGEEEEDDDEEDEEAGEGAPRRIGRRCGPRCSSGARSSC